MFDLPLRLNRFSNINVFKKTVAGFISNCCFLVNCIAPENIVLMPCPIGDINCFQV
jgi:hypothetical protein